MASKKGVIATVLILAAIAAASFVIWIVPQNRGSSLIVSDYKSELNGVIERKSIITTEMDSDLKGLLEKSILPDDFINRAQVSSSQVISLISELIESNPQTEWKSAYLNYAESLKKYTDYLTETISLATKMKGPITDSNLNDEITKIDSIRKDSDYLAEKSNQTRP